MRSEIIDIPTPNDEVEPTVQNTESLYRETEKPDSTETRQDAFGDEANAQIKYKVLKWWYVPVLKQFVSRLLIHPITSGKEVY